MSRPVPFLIVLGVMIFSGSRQRAAEPPKKEIPKPLPKQIVTAWKKSVLKLRGSSSRKYGPNLSSLVLYSVNLAFSSPWIPLPKQAGCRLSWPCKGGR